MILAISLKNSPYRKKIQCHKITAMGVKHLSFRDTLFLALSPLLKHCGVVVQRAAEEKHK